MTVIELLRNAAEIARTEMHDEAAASVLTGQADIVERIEQCRAKGGTHDHPGYDQLTAMLAPEMERPEADRNDLIRRLARQIGKRGGMVN